MLSIVTPIYNREELIRETLDSLLNQTSPDWECLVVDDGSTDRSRETVADYADRDSRIRLLERPGDRTKGPSACRNIGFDHGRGDSVFYLDSDDLLEKNFCENVSNQFSADPQLDFIGVQCVKFVRSIEHLKGGNFKRLSHAAAIRDHYLYETLDVQSETFCWRRSFLDRFPRHWPEDQRVGEDRVCYYRMMTTPCVGAWDDDTIQVLHRTKSVSHGRSDQLTARINIDPELAAQRLMTADRLVGAFRAAGVLDERNVDLLLDNYLVCLRGFLSFRHLNPAARCAENLIALAEEFHRPGAIRTARRYFRLKGLFRFHRIPAVAKTYSTIRRFVTGGK